MPTIEHVGHRWSKEEARIMSLKAQRAKRIKRFREEIKHGAPIKMLKGTIWTAKPNLTQIIRDHNFRVWRSTIILSIINGIIIGLILSNL